MRLVDLSHPLTNNMPAYPGTAPAVILNNASVQKDGYAEKQLNLQSHSGTHIDSPAHMIDAGITLDKLPLTRYMGKALLLDCRGRKVIDRQLLQPEHDRISGFDFVIFHTGWSKFWGQDEYYRDFPVLTAEAAQFLCRFELKGVGVDSCSVDAVTDSGFPTHKILLSNNILIVENLTALDQIGADIFTLCCFPLKILQADGSPVRAVALINES